MEHRLQVIENKVLRRLFRLKRDDIREWSTLKWVA